MRTPLIVEKPVECCEYSCLEEGHHLLTDPCPPLSNDPYGVCGVHTLAFISLGMSAAALATQMSCPDDHYKADSRIETINALCASAIALGSVNLLMNVCLSIAVPQKNLAGRLRTYKCVCESAYFFSLASITLGIFALCYLKGKC